jgi:Ala-tRNA(Pro) deacylase
MSTRELKDALAESGIAYELLVHPRTERAADEAEALEISPDDVAKTIVLVGEQGRARVVLPASERIDLRKVREVLGGGKDVRLATEGELQAEYPMFELGAVPPFGGPAGDRVIVDPRVAERESIVFEAGSHGESLRMKAADLLTLSGAEISDVCRD